MRLEAKMAAVATMHQLQVDSDRRLRRRRLSLLSLLRRQATLLLLSTALLSVGEGLQFLPVSSRVKVPSSRR